MKSLQRLQQHMLATDPLFEHGSLDLTSRAQRLRAAFRRGIAVGVTATAAVTAIGTGIYMKTGPGTFDPQQIFHGDSVSSRRMADIYDTHRKLMAANERIHDIKIDMISNESTGPAALTLGQQAAELRDARREAAHIKQEFAGETLGLTPEQVQKIVADDDTAANRIDDSAPADSEGDTLTYSAPRFRP